MIFLGTWVTTNRQGIKIMTGELDPQTIDSTLHQPVTKLDADQYSAEDLDGITEGLFGSGNLNFLMLQAGQTNGLIAATDPFAITGEGPFSSIAFSSSLGLSSGAAYSENAAESGNRENAGTDGDPALVVDNAPAFENGNTDSGFTPNTIGTLGGSGLVTGNAAMAASASALPGMGESGTDGANGANGAPGNGTTTIVNEGDSLVDVDLGDTSINLGDTVIDAGDVTNLVETTINEVSDLVTNITNNLTETLTDLAGGGLTLQLDALLSENSLLGLDLTSGENTTEIIDRAVDLSPVTSITDDLGLPLPLDPGNLILSDLSSTIGLLGGSDPQHSPEDADLGFGLDLGAGELDIADGITDLALNPAEDLAGDVDIITDLGLGLFDTSNIDNTAGDSDISLGLDTALADNDILPAVNIDVPLDPIESLIGDVDLDLGAGANLLGDAAPGPVDDLAGGSGEDNLLTETQDMLDEAITGALPEPLTDGPLLDDLNLSLLDPSDTDNPAGDTDLSADLGLGIGETGIIDMEPLEIPLDPIESVIGDIDLEIGAALDILNPDSGENLLDTDFSGDVENLDTLGDWTESLLPDSGSLIDGTTGDALGTILPEPLGSVDEGLGDLLGGAEYTPSGGGLFGGGLFR